MRSPAPKTKCRIDLVSSQDCRNMSLTCPKIAFLMFHDPKTCFRPTIPNRWVKFLENTVIFEWFCDPKCPKIMMKLRFCYFRTSPGIDLASDAQRFIAIVMHVRGGRPQKWFAQGKILSSESEAQSSDLSKIKCRNDSGVQIHKIKSVS